MNLKETIQLKLPEFILLCKNHEVKELYVFGSAISCNFDEGKSDIDFLIEIDTNDPIERGEYLLNIWDKFEIFFERKIDLLTNASIKNPILKRNINKSKVLLYDGKKQQISI